MDRDLKLLAAELQLAVLQLRLQAQRAALRGQAAPASVDALSAEGWALVVRIKALADDLAKGG